MKRCRSYPTVFNHHTCTIPMDACDIRVTAYKDGRSFADCRDVAKSLMPSLETQLRKDGQISWDHIMETAEFDAVVYKLALKYLREGGYDIGNHSKQRVSI